MARGGRLDGLRILKTGSDPEQRSTGNDAIRHLFDRGSVVRFARPFRSRKPAFGLPLSDGLVGHAKRPGQLSQPDDFDCL